MPSEIREAGYETIRDWLASASGWDYVALIDDTGAEVTRISISGDSRAAWVHADGSQVLEAEIQISGSDSDIPTPTTFLESASYQVDASTGGTEMARDAFSDQATISQDADDLTITHQVEIPEVV